MEKIVAILLGIFIFMVISYFFSWAIRESLNIKRPPPPPAAKPKSEPKKFKNEMDG